jgi:hypothetical protein
VINHWVAFFGCCWFEPVFRNRCHTAFRKGRIGATDRLDLLRHPVHIHRK